MPITIRPILPAVTLALVGLACTGDGGDGSAADRIDPLDEDVAQVVDELNAYWSQADAELGFDYEPIGTDRITTGTDGVLCDFQPIEPDEVEDNAFVDSGCAEGITVAFDPAYLGRSLATTEATMAHEWGHVIQAQAIELDLSEDQDGLPIDAELQADCFAGAWAAERATSSIEDLRADTAGAGDPGPVDIEDPHAHGTPEDRVAAFDVGVDGGPAACIDQLIDALP